MEAINYRAQFRANLNLKKGQGVVRADVGPLSA